MQSFILVNTLVHKVKSILVFLYIKIKVSGLLWVIFKYSYNNLIVYKIIL